MKSTSLAKEKVDVVVYLNHQDLLSAIFLNMLHSQKKELLLVDSVVFAIVKRMRKGIEKGRKQDFIIEIAMRVSCAVPCSVIFHKKFFFQISLLLLKMNVFDHKYLYTPVLIFIRKKLIFLHVRNIFLNKYFFVKLIC